jgi:hypothetical protein
MVAAVKQLKENGEFIDQRNRFHTNCNEQALASRRRCRYCRPRIRTVTSCHVIYTTLARLSIATLKRLLQVLPRTDQPYTASLISLQKTAYAQS